MKKEFLRKIGIVSLMTLVTIFFLSTAMLHVRADDCGSDRLCNPLDGGSNIGDLLNVLLDTLLKVGAIIGVFFVIYAGFLFVTARGNDTQITKAKMTLLYTLIGLAIILGARVIIAIVKGTFTQIST